MSLRETSSNSIHITDPWKAIEVKTHTIILRDDMEVGTSNHIQVFYPGEDLSSAPTDVQAIATSLWTCLLYTSPSPRDRTRSRMPSSA